MRVATNNPTLNAQQASDLNELLNALQITSSLEEFQKWCTAPNNAIDYLLLGAVTPDTIQTATITAEVPFEQPDKAPPQKPHQPTAEVTELQTIRHSQNQVAYFKYLAIDGFILARLQTLLNPALSNSDCSNLIAEHVRRQVFPQAFDHFDL
jgi:hypothetical protein